MFYQSDRDALSLIVHKLKQLEKTMTTESDAFKAAFGHLGDELGKLSTKIDAIADTIMANLDDKNALIQAATDLGATADGVDAMAAKLPDAAPPAP